MEQLSYIIDLYRDPDPAVAAALDTYFLEGGPDALEELKTHWHNELSPERKAVMGEMLARFNKKAVIRRLKEITAQCSGGECHMLEAGYLAASLTDATLRREDYMSRVVPVVVAAMAEISDSKTAVENVNLLNHVFYFNYGFSALNPFDMTLQGSLLMSVLETRKGSPFALSLLYFIVAQAVGLPVYPLCFTGGFVPVYVENGKVLFNINVFHKGEIFLENNVSKLVKNQASALGVNVDIGEPEVRRDASILVMYLEYLQMLYSNAGDSVAQMDIDDAIAALGGKRFLTIEEDDDNW
ncbi:MAG: hypothetical protein J6X89_02750 [Bacteroidales bacterium]|nr:hypothetical protein [Bacteroidales bacterium]